MTQHPTFIHPVLRHLVDVHYHISHPFKDGKPKVFEFTGSMNTIDDKGAYQAHAVETFTHKLDKETSALYKSVEDGATHDQKRKIPKRIIYMGIFIACLLLIAVPAAIYGVRIAYGFINNAKGQGEEVAADVQGVATGEQSPVSGFKHPSADMTEQLSNAELDALYKKYLDDYTVEVAAHDAIRPDSIMANGGKCKAYNMYGDGLDIPYDKCMGMLLDPSTRPKKRTNSRSMNANASAKPPEPPQSKQDFINNPPPPLPNAS